MALRETNRGCRTCNNSHANDPGSIPAPRTHLQILSHVLLYLALSNVNTSEPRAIGMGRTCNHSMMPRALTLSITKLSNDLHWSQTSILSECVGNDLKGLGKGSHAVGLDALQLTSSPLTQTDLTRRGSSRTKTTSISTLSSISTLPPPGRTAGFFTRERTTHKAS